MKAAKEESTNNRSTESDPSSEKHGGKKKERSLREDNGDDEERVDVGPNEEEEDPRQKRIQVRMETAMHDASEPTEEPEELSDDDDDVEALDGDFALGEYASIAGEDGGLEGISVDDEEMKDPEADDDDDEWADLPGYRTSLCSPGFLPDDLFARAAAAIAITAARV